MNKIYFFASLLAIAAGCSDDEFDSVSADQDKAEGITFVASDADTRILYNNGGAEDSPLWNPFRYAEQDRVTIYANGVAKGYGSGSTTVSYDKWNSLTAVATYKATKFMANADFTSIDDANMLMYIDNTKAAKFFALYAPAETTTPTLSVSNGANNKPDTLTVANLYDGMANQTVKGANKQIVMVAHAESQRGGDSWNAVGEKTKLSFKYTTPILKFGTKN